MHGRLKWVLAAALALVPMSAQAQIRWAVDGTFETFPYPTFTGFVHVDQNFVVDDWSLTTQASGAFTGFTYTPGNSVLTVPNDYGSFGLQAPGQGALFFATPASPGFEQPGVAVWIAGEGFSYECQGSITCGTAPAPGDIRRNTLYAEGFNPLGAPEPATWALLIGGFGMAGAALRRRRRPAPALA